MHGSPSDTAVVPILGGAAEKTWQELQHVKSSSHAAMCQQRLVCRARMQHPTGLLWWCIVVDGGITVVHACRFSTTKDCSSCSCVSAAAYTLQATAAFPHPLTNLGAMGMLHPVPTTSRSRSAAMFYAAYSPLQLQLFCCGRVHPAVHRSHPRPGTHRGAMGGLQHGAVHLVLLPCSRVPAAAVLMQPLVLLPCCSRLAAAP